MKILFLSILLLTACTDLPPTQTPRLDKGPFPHEALAGRGRDSVGRDHLQRQLAARVHLTHSIHTSHSSLPKLLENLEGPKPLADLWGGLPARC